MSNKIQDRQEWADPMIANTIHDPYGWGHTPLDIKHGWGSKGLSRPLYCKTRFWQTHFDQLSKLLTVKTFSLCITFQVICVVKGIIWYADHFTSLCHYTYIDAHGPTIWNIYLVLNDQCAVPLNIPSLVFLHFELHNNIYPHFVGGEGYWGLPLCHSQLHYANLIFYNIIPSYIGVCTFESHFPLLCIPISWVNIFHGGKGGILILLFHYMSILCFPCFCFSCKIN